MPMFEEIEPVTAGDLITARGTLLSAAAAKELVPRYVASCFHSMGAEHTNTGDGCFIGMFRVEQTLEDIGREVRVSVPLDAPREEVAAVLRHLLAAIEADEPPALKGVSRNAR